MKLKWFFTRDFKESTHREWIQYLIIFYIINTLLVVGYSLVVKESLFTINKIFYILLFPLDVNILAIIGIFKDYLRRSHTTFWFFTKDIKDYTKKDWLSIIGITYIFNTLIILMYSIILNETLFSYDKILCLLLFPLLMNTIEITEIIKK